MEFTVTQTFWIEIDEILEEVKKHPKWSVEEVVDDYIAGLDDYIYGLALEVENEIISAVRARIED